jgi:hypothetical protein
LCLLRVFGNVGVQFGDIGGVMPVSVSHTDPARLVSPVYIGNWLIGIASLRVGRLPLTVGLSRR